MLAAVEADIVGVFLCVGLFRAVLLLYGEPLSRYLHIVADRQDEELPGGEVHRHHEFCPHFLGPPGRRVGTDLLLQDSLPVVDRKFHL